MIGQNINTFDDSEINNEEAAAQNAAKLTINSYCDPFKSLQLLYYFIFAGMGIYLFVFQLTAHMIKNLHRRY